jgi:hypothetical protein
VVAPVPSALGHSERVAKSLGQALSEETEFALRGVGEYVVGVGEELSTHSELDGFRGVSQTGYEPTAAVTDHIARFALGTVPRQ